MLFMTMEYRRTEHRLITLGGACIRGAIRGKGRLIHGMSGLDGSHGRGGSGGSGGDDGGDDGCGGDGGAGGIGGIGGGGGGGGGLSGISAGFPSWVDSRALAASRREGTVRLRYTV